jgi:putative membrane protein
MLKDIRNFINGSVYGITLIVPGISATIFAIILGFYDELLNALNHFREDYRKNIRYLAGFLLGIITGAVIFSYIISYLLAHFSLPTMLFFMGLLVGIVPFIFSKAKGSARRIAPREIALTILSMSALYALSRAVNETAVNPSDAINAMSVALILYIFLAGIINGATLVIPGLSGAFILLIMGLYPLVIYSISSVGVFFRDVGNFLLLRDIGMVLLPFGVGALIGCLCMARIMEKLMQRFYKAVYAVILGLLLGSVITLLQNPLMYQSGTSIIPLIVGVVAFCAGCVLAYRLPQTHGSF